jgi:hypothetical protein
MRCAQVAWSPDERLILTGTSADRGGEGGSVAFFDLDSRRLVRRLGMPSSVVSLQWHARLNQIFLGVGARSSQPACNPGASCAASLEVVLAHLP